MGDIVLSAGVRQNLLSLQNTAALMATTQNRLATGKKVNSALENPISFFTSQALTNRAGDLSSLLDSIGQAQQTLKSSDDGITSLTKLVQTAKSIATQASQATKGTVTYTNITGTGTLPADTTRVDGTVSAATAGVASQQAESHFLAAGIAQLANTDELEFTLGSGTTVTATFAAANAVGTNKFHDAAGLIAVLNGGTGPSGKFTITDAQAESDGAGGVVLGAANLTDDFTVAYTNNGGTLAAANFTSASVVHSLGDAFTASDGTHTNTFYRVADDHGATVAGNIYTDSTTLASQITASAAGTGGGGDITASAVGAMLRLSAATNKTVSVAGLAGFAQGFAAPPYSNNYNSALAPLNGLSFAVQVGSNTAHNVTFGTANGQVATKHALNTMLAAFNDIGGSVNSSNLVNFDPTSSDDVAISGNATVLLALGLNASTTTPIGTVVSAGTTRASLQSDYNNLMTQIDALAKDASYNGVNLLYGDNLKVVFNENGTSLLDITGVRYDSAGLGLSNITGTGFQDDHAIKATLTTLDTSLASLRTQSAKFGSTLTTVQARQDFTKNLINTLQTGADNLVLADTNEEGANMLALQTRQSLSTTALSLANQASQAVLRLFG